MMMICTDTQLYIYIHTERETISRAGEWDSLATGWRERATCSAAGIDVCRGNRRVYSTAAAARRHRRHPCAQGWFHPHRAAAPGAGWRWTSIGRAALARRRGEGAAVGGAQCARNPAVGHVASGRGALLSLFLPRSRFRTPSRPLARSFSLLYIRNHHRRCRLSIRGFWSFPFSPSLPLVRVPPLFFHFSL